MSGPLLADRVMETAGTVGTGAYTLSGALTGFQPFSSGIGQGNSCWYTAEQVDSGGTPTGDWEVAIGTFSGGILSRDAIIQSTNNDNAVNFASGVKRIFVALPSEATFLSGAILSSGFVLTSGIIQSGLIGNGAVNSGNLSSGQVGINHFQSGLLSGLILSGQIGSGQIGVIHANSGLFSGLILSGQIGSGQVDWPHLVSGLVSGVILSGQLGSGQIDWPHLISGLVSGLILSGRIGSGQIGHFHIASGSLDGFELGSGSIVSGRIASGQVGVNHLESGLVSGLILSGRIGSGQIGTVHACSGGLLSGAFGSGQLAHPHFGSGAVLSGDIASGQVGFGHLADGSVRSGTLASGIAPYAVGFGGNANPALFNKITFDGEFVTGTTPNLTVYPNLPSLCKARLSLLSGNPVPTVESSGASSINLVPYNGNEISYYDGVKWYKRPIRDTAGNYNVSLSLGVVTSGLPYDVYSYWDATGFLGFGCVVLETVAWTNLTTRSVNLSLVDNVYVKSTDTSRRYHGYFITTTTSTTEDTYNNRNLVNQYETEQSILPFNTIPDNVWIQNKNAVVNGDMVVAQVGTSFTNVQSGNYTLDQWAWSRAGTHTVNVEQTSGSNGGPTPSILVPNSINTLRLTAISGQTSLTSGHYGMIYQPIESVSWDNYWQRPVTVSFWSKSQPGIFSVSLRNGSRDYSFVHDCTIATSGVWQFFEVNVPPSPFSGAWLHGNGTTGVYLGFCICKASGSFETTPDVWNSGNFFGTSGTANFLTASGITFQLAQVQLEVGKTYTPFEIVAPAVRMAACERFYQKSYPIHNSPGAASINQNLTMMTAGATTTLYGNQPLRSRMCKTPTMQLWSFAGTSGKVTLIGGGDTGGTVTAAGVGDGGFYAASDASAPFSVGAFYIYHWEAAARLT